MTLKNIRQLSLLISSAAVMLMTFSVFANPLDDNCPLFVPDHYPVINSTSDIEFKCMKRYGVAYDVDSKIPVYVATKLTADELNGRVRRGNNFHVDDTIKTASPNDFVGTDYDKGHLAEAELFTTDQEAMDQSFDMINMHAQWFNLNRGIWHALENYSHTLAMKYGMVYIISGTVYNKQSPTIGSGVTVPEYSWKVIVVPSTNTVEAYMIPNGHHDHQQFKMFKTTTDAISIATGLKFN